MMSQPSQAADGQESFDYIIVGGGTAGLIIASRLKKALPSRSILVIEAGGDPSHQSAHQDYQNVHNYTGMHMLRASSVTSWTLTSDDGPGLENRVTDAAAGKGLGGSSLINAGMWMRGPKTDWDFWARTVGDERWNYENMLPFFQLSEKLANTTSTEQDSQHGHDGYVEVRPTSATDKKFPLRDTVKKMWSEVGVEYLPDMNSGYQNGACEAIDIWQKGGARQLPGQFLDLSGVDIWTNTPVSKIVIDTLDHGNVATGVSLADGRIVKANKEVILCAGAYHSPQLLQLSGIGPRSLLEPLSIETKLDNSDVGAHLADHLIVTLTWKLRNPEEGLAFGSPKCTQPFWLEGLPMDIITYEHLPTNPDSKLATLANERHDEPLRELILRPDASHIQNWLVYLPLPAALTGINVPVDGSYISTFTCLTTPTSRGHVTIQSPDPKIQPIIAKNFQSTPADRYMLTSALKRISDVVLTTKTGKSFVESEVTPEGFETITNATSDDEIQRRIARFAWSISHPMGTCGMGRVVDAQCRVTGVRGLRVVDASVIPVPVAATIQAVVYALAERAAAFVVESEERVRWS